MLIKHPKIYLDAAGATTDALLVRNGRIAAAGQEARLLWGDGEALVEPEGVCLFPALADAHCHLWGVGLRADSVELSGTNSPQDVYERLAEQAAEEPASGWVFGYGWDEHDWPGDRLLSRHELDEIFEDVPVCLHRVDRHAIA